MYDRTDMIGTGMTGIMELQSLTGCPSHEQPGGLTTEFTHSRGSGLIKLISGNCLSCKHTSSDVHGMTLRHFAEQQLSLETVLCLQKVLRHCF